MGQIHTTRNEHDNKHFVIDQINNQKQILKQGDGFYIPPNAVHGCVCLEKGVLIDVFSPKREDFLK